MYPETPQKSPAIKALEEARLRLKGKYDEQVRLNNVHAEKATTYLDAMGEIDRQIATVERLERPQPQSACASSL